jgi:hypothetical protein
MGVWEICIGRSHGRYVEDDNRSTERGYGGCGGGKIKEDTNRVLTSNRI